MLLVTVSSGIVRLKRFTLDLLFSRFQVKSTSTARVVVLIPPPQEPGDAPINIRNRKNARVELFNDAMSTVLNPAVRQVTDWKKEIRIHSLHELPVNRELDSVTDISSIPDIINNPVVNRTTFV